jgi:hypothetical protein
MRRKSVRRSLPEQSFSDGGTLNEEWRKAVVYAQNNLNCRPVSFVLPCEII